MSDEVVAIKARPAAEFEDVRALMCNARGRDAPKGDDFDAGVIWAGQVQGPIHDVPTCHDLIDHITREAADILRQRFPTIMTLDAVDAQREFGRTAAP